MPRRATGEIIERVGADGRTYRSLRFRAYGRRRFVSLGCVPRDEAEATLRGILADVERGIWQPHEPAPAPAPPMGSVLFHEFAEQWWIEHCGEWRGAADDPGDEESTTADYRWRLEHHLLPFFKDHRLDAITVAEVDRYKASKLAESARQAKAIAAAAAVGKPRPRHPNGQPIKPLSARSINMTLVTLAAILDVAEERDLIVRNTAKGKRRRVKNAKPTRTYLDAAAQIVALLGAARELDAKATAKRRHVARHAILATLVFAGLRIAELLDLRWQDVDLATGRLRVGRKTAASVRYVTIRPALRDVLLALKASAASTAPSAYVFATATGGRMSATNVRTRVLAAAVKLANSHAEQDGDAPTLPHLTPHSLRRTFASVLYALGEAPPVVMAEMGHTDPALALAIYAHAMRRGPEEVARLRALVNGDPTSSAQTAQTPVDRLQTVVIQEDAGFVAERAKTPVG